MLMETDIVAVIFQRAEEFPGISNICHDRRWGGLKMLDLRPTMRAELPEGVFGY